MNYLEITGAITLSIIGLAIAAIVALLLYMAIRALVFGADYLRWYLAASKKHFPDHVHKMNKFMMYCASVKLMWDYSPGSVHFTLNNGMKYTPFAKV
jgi:hypothetical protein